MNPAVNEILGPLVVALAILVSAAYALRHLAPRSSARLQAVLARRLQATGRRRMRRLGERLMPRTVEGSNCGGGCGTCGGCAPKRVEPTERPIEFRPRS